MSALAKAKKTEVVQQPTTEADAFLSMIERAARDPAVDINKMERLFEMADRVRRRDAEVAFNSAMSAAQEALVPIVKNKPNGQTKSKYADISALAEQAMPTIYSHGFGLTFSEFQSEKLDHVGIACIVRHKAGFSERHEFHIPTDGAGLKGNANKTATHAYGSTTTYGRRYATCCVFNIATKDDDGNAASVKVNDLISDEQVAELQKLILETKTDVKEFLSLGEIESLTEITKENFPSALAVLKRRKTEQAKGTQ